MAGNYALKYNVDIAFCIDATMSMYKILDKVKDGVLNFYTDLVRAMEAKGKHVDNLRARVIAFRDYTYDHEDAMMVTDFFSLPQQSQQFAQCIRSIVPKGGGDDPEDALEALAYAIRSDWFQSSSTMKRQIIVMWTDAAPHPIGYGQPSKDYPAGMPKTLAELSGWWGAKNAPGYMDNRAKRLLLYAPDDPTWNSIIDSWNNSIYFPSKAGEGLQEFEYNQIIDVIAGSI